ncbi:MAG: ACT domain-containing protein [Gammaproteobacteria bacterium]|nr:ACT domain-containing protein [Gammaproteobacteria bacterium]MDH3412247.1 ACT domain-containing protein [Gammaproteobacteria bacterium]
MAFNIRRADYYYIMVKAEPEEGYKLLSDLAELGVNLLAFTAIPFGPMRSQLTLFPDDALKMEDAAKKAGIALDGPHPALLVQGDDQLGVLAKIHEKLYDANVHVFASSGVSDGRGGYGYVIYVRPEEYERAAAALEI